MKFIEGNVAVVTGAAGGIGDSPIGYYIDDVPFAVPNSPIAPPLGPVFEEGVGIDAQLFEERGQHGRGEPVGGGGARVQHRLGGVRCAGVGHLPGGVFPKALGRPGGQPPGDVAVAVDGEGVLAARVARAGEAEAQQLGAGVPGFEL